MKYSVTFCSQLEVASDVISGVPAGEVGLDVHVKFGDSRSNCSRAVRPVRFVMNNEQRTKKNGVDGIKQ